MMKSWKEFLNKFEELRKVKEDIEAEMKQKEEAEANATAYSNAYDAFWDGIKYIADESNPFTLVLPQAVKANMYYKVNDGLKDIIYVCYKDGICTADNFDEHMVKNTL